MAGTVFTTYGKSGIDAAIAGAKARASHTGTQTSSTVSDFQEAVEDVVAALLGRSTMAGITWTYNDASGTLSASVTASGGVDAEAARDTIGAALIGIGNISIAVNDAADTITISTTATVNDTDANLKNRANHTGNQAISTVSGLQTALDALSGSVSTLTTDTATNILTAFLTTFRVLPRVRWTGSAWESRSSIIPTGYTGPVIFDSATGTSMDAAAPAPPFTHAGDEWQFHPASPYTPWA